MAVSGKDPLYKKLKYVGSDEKPHEEFLIKALSAAGAKPAERCINSFPVTDAKSFLALNSMLEDKFSFDLRHVTSGVLIAGKLGFSLVARAARRYHLNIYNDMYASITMSLVYQKINCGYF